MIIDDPEALAFAGGRTSYLNDKHVLSDCVEHSTCFAPGQLMNAAKFQSMEE